MLPEHLSDKDVENISKQLLQAFDKSHQPTPVDPERIISLIPDPNSKDGLLMRYVAQVGTGTINGELRLDPKHIDVQHTVDVGPGTNQAQSGRCWIFAGLNMMRSKMLEEYGSDFEYSQNYTAFWDKIERANYFMEKVIELKDLEPTDPVLSSHLSHGFSDGGWWPYFSNVVEKYGVVPKDAMPETKFSGSSGGYMQAAQGYLRQVGCVLHRKAQEGAPRGELEAIKQKGLDELSKLMMHYLGTPPTSFLWQNKEGELSQLNPHQFLEQNPTDFSQFIEVSDFPHLPRNAIIEVPHDGNLVGGKTALFLNVGMDVMKEAVRASIKDGQAVWFGSDVTNLDLDKKIFTTDWDKSAQMLGLNPPEELNKADLLRYQVQGLSHAMSFVGCDDADYSRVPKEFNGNLSELYSAPVWKIENSWERAESILASDKWLDEHLYTVVVDRKYLPQAVCELWDNPFTKRVSVYNGEV